MRKIRMNAISSSRSDSMSQFRSVMTTTTSSLPPIDANERLCAPRNLWEANLLWAWEYMARMRALAHWTAAIASLVFFARRRCAVHFVYSFDIVIVSVKLNYVLSFINCFLFVLRLLLLVQLHCSATASASSRCRASFSRSVSVAVCVCTYFITVMRVSDNWAEAMWPVSMFFSVYNAGSRTSSFVLSI